MTTLAQSVLSHLDKAALLYIEDGDFELINSPPEWFADIWGDSARLKLVGPSDYLDNFIVDAVEFWMAGSQGFLPSGPFVESNLKHGELPLEAVALLIDGEPVILISNLGARHKENTRVLQAARENLLTQEQLEIEVSKRTALIRERESEISGRLIYASGFRDEETGSHIRRIGLYSAEMGRALGWSQFDIDDICAAAPMHDIGKIGIPDRILKKPGKLTEEEFAVMKAHPEIGAEILGGSNIDMIEVAADIARCHHECWDGSGYPAGLKGESIPIAARIVAIVDVYDALVHKRVYKEELTESEALKIMDGLVGTKFDPQLFQVFLDNLEAMRRIKDEIADEP